MLQKGKSAIKAGIPHLVVANSFDQFDNGWRLERLGLGRSIPQTRYRAAAVTQAIRGIHDDRRMQTRCHDFASRVDPRAALVRASELIEGLETQLRAI